MKLTKIRPEETVKKRDRGEIKPKNRIPFLRIAEQKNKEYLTNKKKSIAFENHPDYGSNHEQGSEIFQHKEICALICTNEMQYAYKCNAVVRERFSNVQRYS